MDNKAIIIEPLSASHRGRWSPVVGNEASEFLNSVVPIQSQVTIRDSALSILSRSIPPTEVSGQETGLVVGYVQSGKTMSFEAVAALARDNSFQIVIVIAGKSNPLLAQSVGRLKRDLGLDDADRGRRWTQFNNPIPNDLTIQAIRDVLEDWRDSSTPQEYRRTILITVLKHHSRLGSLAELLDKLVLARVPTLIIDDEADQASLNTEVAQGQESSTYHNILAVRNALPNHTYLQYTATPQAPLLINIIDSLSPNFVQVLEPGDDYVGGRDFFNVGANNIHLIPDQEVPTRANPLSEPPSTLLYALRIFMVGVAIGFHKSRNTGNRSMLVHPSHRTIQHREFYNWVRDIFDEWRRILNLPDADPDKQELINEFREAYDDLLLTLDEDIPAFTELKNFFSFAFRNTRVIEVNAATGPTPHIDWNDSYGWILVGGQAMDRGFTVEGLTVTYMPRGIGTGNADTVQQRARFFGYKRRYLGYCRLFLEQGTIDAFRAYIEHEEDIRNQLTEYQNDQRPLNNWKRAFLLDSALSPCRRNVLEFDYMRGSFSNSWVSPAIVLANEEIIRENQNAVGQFVSRLTFSDDVGHNDRTSAQRHQICENVSLEFAVSELLANIRIPGIVDSQRNTGLLLQLRKALDENPNELCTVYRISFREKRRRSVDDNGEISNLFQGAYPVAPKEIQGSIYPGDREIRQGGRVNIQIHVVDITRRDDQNSVVAKDVPVIAVWVPSNISADWLVQDRQ